MKTKVLLFAFLMLSNFAFAQISEITKINSLLDTETYYEIRLNYDITVVLSDSVRQKFLATLRGEVPQHLADSILYIYQQEKDELWDFCKNRCRGDSICAEEMFNNLLQDRYNHKRRRLYDSYQINRTVILAAGSWNIREAIPILENAIGNERYGQRSILMALTKLGNDSIKQSLIERYTLSYILQTTELDTINDNHFYGQNNLTSRLFDEGMQVAMYLKNKDIILNLLDLIYIRGRDDVQGFETPLYTVVWFVWNLSSFHFHNFPNYEILYEISDDYIFAIRNLERRRRNRNEDRELERLLSTEHRTKVKNQIQDWIIENVNFTEDEQ
jgi:hypothetical protein